MVARAKWEKFSAIFCNIFTKKKKPERYNVIANQPRTTHVIANQWCSAQRIKIIITAGGSDTII